MIDSQYLIILNIMFILENILIIRFYSELVHTFRHIDITKKNMAYLCIVIVIIMGVLYKHRV